MYKTVITPTEYDGHEFRSFLEANWAAFFNALRIPYEYEPYRIELGDLTYLPDFRLPQQRAWIEIKPTRIHAFPAQRKIRRLAAATQGIVIVFCDGFREPLMGWRMRTDGIMQPGYQFAVDDDGPVQLTNTLWDRTDHPRIRHAIRAVPMFLRQNERVNDSDLLSIARPYLYSHAFTQDERAPNGRGIHRLVRHVANHMKVAG